jgi:hypothetical protein
MLNYPANDLSTEKNATILQTARAATINRLIAHVKLYMLIRYCRLTNNTAAVLALTVGARAVLYQKKL